MNILCLSPHVDDVHLGAGGSIHRWIQEKHTIIIVTFTIEGLEEHYNLEEEFKDACEFSGITHTYIHKYQNKNLEANRQDILDSLVWYRDQFQPSIVIGPNSNDIHQDHQTIYNEMIRAFKTYCTIIGYESIWKNISQENNYYVRLTDEDVKHKLISLSRFKSQLDRPYFEEDFLIGWLRRRGVESNSRFAECFEVRKVIS